MSIYVKCLRGDMYRCAMFTLLLVSLSVLACQKLRGARADSFLPMSASERQAMLKMPSTLSLVSCGESAGRRS